MSAIRAVRGSPVVARRGSKAKIESSETKFMRTLSAIAIDPEEQQHVISAACDLLRSHDIASAHLDDITDGERQGEGLVRCQCLFFKFHDRFLLGNFPIIYFPLHLYTQRSSP